MPAPSWTIQALELRPSSVYRKLGAGREGRVEREEEDGLRDFLRRPPALHRIDVAHLPSDLGSHVFLGEHLVQDRRVDGAGRHRVNANLARQKLNSEHPSERPERSLGGSVGAIPGIPLTFATEVVKTTAPPRFINGASFCTAKYG